VPSARLRIDPAGAVLLTLRLGGERGRGFHQQRPQFLRLDRRVALDQERYSAWAAATEVPVVSW